MKEEIVPVPSMEDVIEVAKKDGHDNMARILKQAKEEYELNKEMQRINQGK